MEVLTPIIYCSSDFDEVLLMNFLGKSLSEKCNNIVQL